MKDEDAFLRLLQEQYEKDCRNKQQQQQQQQQQHDADCEMSESLDASSASGRGGESERQQQYQQQGACESGFLENQRSFVLEMDRVQGAEYELDNFESTVMSQREDIERDRSERAEIEYWKLIALHELLMEKRPSSTYRGITAYGLAREAPLLFDSDHPAKCRADTCEEIYHMERGRMFHNVFRPEERIRATGDVYFCKRSGRVHFCGEQRCTALEVVPRSEGCVCYISGRVMNPILRQQRFLLPHQYRTEDANTLFPVRSTRASSSNTTFAQPLRANSSSSSNNLSSQQSLDVLSRSAMTTSFTPRGMGVKGAIEFPATTRIIATPFSTSTAATTSTTTASAFAPPQTSSYTETLRKRDYCVTPSLSMSSSSIRTPGTRAVSLSMSMQEQQQQLEEDDNSYNARMLSTEKSQWISENVSNLYRSAASQLGADPESATRAPVLEMEAHKEEQKLRLKMQQQQQHMGLRSSAPSIGFTPMVLPTPVSAQLERTRRFMPSASIHTPPQQHQSTGYFASATTPVVQPSSSSVSPHIRTVNSGELSASLSSISITPQSRRLQEEEQQQQQNSSSSKITAAVGGAAASTTIGGGLEPGGVVGPAELLLKHGQQQRQQHQEIFTIDGGSRLRSERELLDPRYAKRVQRKTSLGKNGILENTKPSHTKLIATMVHDFIYPCNRSQIPNPPKYSSSSRSSSSSKNSSSSASGAGTAQISKSYSMPSLHSIQSIGAPEVKRLLSLYAHKRPKLSNDQVSRSESLTSTTTSSSSSSNTSIGPYQEEEDYDDDDDEDKTMILVEEDNHNRSCSKSGSEEEEEEEEEDNSMSLCVSSLRTEHQVRTEVLFYFTKCVLKLWSILRTTFYAEKSVKKHLDVTQCVAALIYSLESGISIETLIDPSDGRILSHPGAPTSSSSLSQSSSSSSLLGRKRPAAEAVSQQQQQQEQGKRFVVEFIPKHSYLTHQLVPKSCIKHIRATTYNHVLSVVGNNTNDLEALCGTLNIRNKHVSGLAATSTATAATAATTSLKDLHYYDVSYMNGSKYVEMCYTSIFQRAFYVQDLKPFLLKTHMEKMEFL